MPCAHCALSLLSVPHCERNIITWSLASLLLSSFSRAVVIAVAASLREFFLSACHLCIFSHLLSLLCEMSSFGEMGEAIELR